MSFTGFLTMVRSRPSQEFHRFIFTGKPVPWKRRSGRRSRTSVPQGLKWSAWNWSRTQFCCAANLLDPFQDRKRKHGVTEKVTEKGTAYFSDPIKGNSRCPLFVPSPQPSG